MRSNTVRYFQGDRLMDVKVINNVDEIVRDDMEKTIKKGSVVSVAAAYFSIYAYEELKKQLESRIFQSF